MGSPDWLPVRGPLQVLGRNQAGPFPAVLLLAAGELGDERIRLGSDFLVTRAGRDPSSFDARAGDPSDQPVLCQQEHYEGSQGKEG